MRILTTLISLLAVGALAIGCGGSAPAVDMKDPASVTGAIFAAASAGDPSGLKGLCDPKGEGDKDTKTVCAMTKEDPKWEEFTKYFGKGKVDGAAKVDGDKAKVNFLFGPEGKKTETMNLVQRDGNWYLSSF